MHDVPGFNFDRRALMRSAILLVGGAAVATPALAFAQTPAFFTPAEHATLDAMCATMIPKTDTPGALEVGVPAFLDGMMTNWATDRIRSGFRNVLTSLDSLATEGWGKGFAALSPADRTQCLTEYDAAQFAARTGPYGRFKELLLMGYYLSEPGATQELRYELVPGMWEPKTAVGPDTRAWAVG